MKKGTIIAIAIGTIIAAVLAVFLHIHRNVIFALLKGDDLPEVPEGHPEVCPLTKRNI